MSVKLTKAVFSGTFDPFTLGHEDVLLRSLPLFDQVTVLIGVPPNKKPLIPADDRVKMLKKHFKSQSSKIVVDSWPGLIVDYCAKKEIYSIIRGLRNSADFEIEREMAMMNQSMNIKCETVFLMTHPACSFISSSLVREIYRHGGQVKDYVPLEIYKHLEAHKAKYVS